MRKIIKLKDYKSTVLGAAIKRNNNVFIPETLILQAIEFHCKRNLKFNNVTGITTDITGFQGSYVSKFEPYNNEYDAAEWEFTGCIRSSASMLQRGFTLK